MRIKNILVPIDFSQRSLETVAVAQTLAKEFGANLHLAHVYDRDFPLTTVMEMPLALPPVEVARGVRRHLKDVAKNFDLELRPRFAHAAEGRPFEEICRLARRHRIDLIVIATRGNTGLKHLLLGSTAERIVRYSPCPVLVIHPRQENEKRELRFNRIVVPIDFSACSLKGLEVLRFAQDDKGALRSAVRAGPSGRTCERDWSRALLAGTVPATTLGAKR